MGKKKKVSVDECKHRLSSTMKVTISSGKCDLGKMMKDARKYLDTVEFDMDKLKDSMVAEALYLAAVFETIEGVSETKKKGRIDIKIDKNARQFKKMD